MSFWSSRACLQLPSTLNRRAEPDTGHGIPEGPRAACSRGTRRGSGSTKPPAGRHSAITRRRGLGHSGRSTEEPDAGGVKRGGREERPADVHGPPGAPRRRARGQASPPCRRPFLLGPLLASSHFPPPAHHHPYRAPARHLHVSAGHLHRLLAHLQAHGTRSGPGSASSVGPASCAPPSRAWGCSLVPPSCRRGRAPRLSGRGRGEGRSESGEDRSGRGLWNVCRDGRGQRAGHASRPSDAREKGRPGSRDWYEGRRDCALDTFAQNLNGWYHCLIFTYALFFNLSSVEFQQTNFTGRFDITPKLQIENQHHLFPQGTGTNTIETV